LHESITVKPYFRVLLFQEMLHLDRRLQHLLGRLENPVTRLHQGFDLLAAGMRPSVTVFGERAIHPVDVEFPVSKRRRHVHRSHPHRRTTSDHAFDAHRMVLGNPCHRFQVVPVNQVPQPHRTPLQGFPEPGMADTSHQVDRSLLGLPEHFWLVRSGIAVHMEIRHDPALHQVIVRTRNGDDGAAQLLPGIGKARPVAGNRGSARQELVTLLQHGEQPYGFRHLVVPVLVCHHADHLIASNLMSRCGKW